MIHAWTSYKKWVHAGNANRETQKTNLQHVVCNVAVAMVNIHVSREVLKLVSEVKLAAKTHFHK